MNKSSLLKKIPKVDLVLAEIEKKIPDTPRQILLNAIRRVLEDIRQKIRLEQDDIVGENLSGHPFDNNESLFDMNKILNEIELKVSESMTFNLKRVINATGVVVHTNLGRSILSSHSIENMKLIAGRYSNLEYDLANGVRGSRYSCVSEILCDLTGAEAALVVNNNAAAVLITLNSLAKNKEVIVSRGELVEIGGSFRMTDVMVSSGAILKEVGTTNRTHFKDYESAINPNSGLLMKVHTSNYGIVGFTADVPLLELVKLGRQYFVPVMKDLGSGCFIDFTKYGLQKEPTVQDAIATGVDVITFSGDKLLGGPQAGIILGKKEFINIIKKNPLNRALRIDKLTLAALEATLKQYYDEEQAIKEIPTLNMLTQSSDTIKSRAEKLFDLLNENKNPDLKCCLLTLSSRVGGGALPLQELPSHCVGIAIDGVSANRLSIFFRGYHPPIIGRIQDEMFIIDLRTVQNDEIETIYNAVTKFSKIHSNFKANMQ